MKINAAVLFEVNTPFQFVTLDLAPPQSGEVLVKIAAAGVCHSDWHLVTGATRHPLPVVAGHEGAGEVVAVGPSVTRVQPGDHVALNWAPNCGSCFYCLNDQPSLCATYVDPIWAGTMLDGTPRLSLDGQPIYHFSGLACFAEYTVVPQESCVCLPATIPSQVAALIGCAVTTGVGAVLNTARLQPGSSVAVFGAGGVGLSAVLGARLAGAGEIITVDRTEAKGRLSLEFGATHSLTTSDHTASQIRELTGGRGADVVFEATGIPAVQEACLEAVRPGGELILVGIAPMGTQTNFPSALLTRQEKRVTGCYYGSANSARDFPRYAELYLQGRLDLDRLVSRTYSLLELNRAYADMLAGDLARGVIIFEKNG
jgi:Zn-dependent alcohol dehydrogenase